MWNNFIQNLRGNIVICKNKSADFENKSCLQDNLSKHCPI
jgi:hypothetical protein